MPRNFNGASIYTRDEWGAKGSYRFPLGTVSHDIWHHFFRPDVSPAASVSVEKRVMRGVENFHIDKGWARIAYNFIIFPSGRIYEGCGFHQRGAHAVGMNHVSKAVCFATDGDRHKLTVASFNSSVRLRRAMIKRGSITKVSRISPHAKWAAKSCPGEKVKPDLSRIRRLSLQSGNVLALPEEEMYAITSGSRPYQRRHFQRVVNRLMVKHGLKFKDTKTGETRTSLVEDGDWGPNTNAAWQIVADTLPRVNYTEDKVYAHDWIEMRHKVA